MVSLPAGTFTFLFTDIEGSTNLWEQYPDAMRLALARHDALLRNAIEANHGAVFKTVGDAFCAAFATAPDAMAATINAQRALQAEAWGDVGSLKVRMALHTGVAEERGSDYFGPPLNRVSRLLNAGHGGQILLSQAAADLLVGAMPLGASLRDLGAHRLKDLQQPEHLFQLDHLDLPSEFPPLRSLEAFSHNLPRQLTSFIGREQEMDTVKRLLATMPLLTLTGAGGCGKTRLALQVAVDLVDEYTDGVWVVELAALADPSLIPQTVAAALGVREEPGRPLTDTLRDHLRPKALLLVLDNCEHLRLACAQMVENLLRSCPRLRILATSREGLGISGEQTHRVPSLSVPDAEHLPPLEKLHEFEAVQLFADRARLGQPTFAVADDNAPAVARVCQRLDGIPLAIELAAARVKALSVAKLNERLDDMFRLLTGGSQTAPPRQQTLRALIDWSYDLLIGPEQALLRRLSVFAGGWTLEAAEEVCSGDGAETWEVLDLLTGLVEKSLVLYDEREEEGRYRLLETVGQYARDRLLEAGESQDVRDRYASWFLALAEQAEPRLRGREHQQWMGRLEREHDNLRSALAWTSTQGHGAAGLRLSGALSAFWDVQGYLREGKEHLARALALPGAEARTAPRAKALHGAGQLAQRLGERPAAWALSEESLAIYRELGDQEGTAGSLWALGDLARIQGDLVGSRAHLQASLAIYQALGDQWGIAFSLNRLGMVSAHQGDLVAARVLSSESLAICRALGNQWGIALSLNDLGYFAKYQGEYGTARELFQESLALYQELGEKRMIAFLQCNLGEVDLALENNPAAQSLFEKSLSGFRQIANKSGIVWSLSSLGELHSIQGNYAAARAFFEESLAIYQELDEKRQTAWALHKLGRVAFCQEDYEAARMFFREGLAISFETAHKLDVAQCLEGLAAVSAAVAEPERAARLFGAAEAMREAIGASIPPAGYAEHNCSVEAVRAVVGERAFAEAWVEGRSMTFEDAIAFALQEARDA